MGTNLRKFAASYMIAYKMSYESMNRGTVEFIAESLELSAETLLSL